MARDSGSSGASSWLLQPLALALASAALLVLAFPNFNLPWAAWIALVPWLLLLRRVSGRAAFGWSYYIGLLFFLGSIHWLVRVTLVGWLVLSGFLALYFGLFGWLVTTGWRVQAGATGREKRRLGTERRWGQAYAFIGIPAIWVALEYARSHALSGFGWNLLAYSQTLQLRFIQFADLTGAWGVSFVLVLANVALAEMADALAWATGSRAEDRLAFQRATRHVTSAILTLVVLMGYGSWRLAAAAPGPPVRIAVVQGNIPQEEKWDEALRDSILARYEALTRTAVALDPQLIVWPETAVPGFLGLDEPLTQRIAAVAGSSGVPLLAGAPHGRRSGGRWEITNGAALVDPAGVRGWYDKLHLVPYGEFIPFERQLPWLRETLPPIGDFVAGDAFTVFTAPLRNDAADLDDVRAMLAMSPSVLRFSALICFEDLFPSLARRFVREGARVLVVITNDAWFGPTAAAYQHAQASTLRAVELRVPVVRAANTGWSGCIDASGRWTGSVHDDSGEELFIPGVHACEVSPGPAESLYLHLGDWFALLCVGISAAILWVRRPWRRAL